jgi:hypothetical protein
MALSKQQRAQLQQLRSRRPGASSEQLRARAGIPGLQAPTPVPGSVAGTGGAGSPGGSFGGGGRSGGGGGGSGSPSGGGGSAPPSGGGGDGGGGEADQVRSINPVSGTLRPEGLGHGFSQQIQDMFTQLFQEGSSGGSLAALNNASNRLRERVSGAEAGQLEQVRGRNIGRGFASSGINEAQEAGVLGGSQQALTQGLSDLQLGFEDRRLQGLQTALGAAGGLSGAGTAFDKSLIDRLGIETGAATTRRGQDIQKEIAKFTGKNKGLQDFINSIIGISGNSSYIPG